MSQRMIYDHLVSNDLFPQSISITKELRDWVRKARSRQRIDLAEIKQKEASDPRMRKAEALTKDIGVLKPKKVMLEKLQKLWKVIQRVSCWKLLKFQQKPMLMPLKQKV